MGGVASNIARFRGCETIYGYLAVVGSARADLAPLSSLRQIVALAALPGPGGHGLVLARNSRLRGVAALAALRRVDGGVAVEDNPRLLSLARFNPRRLGRNNAGNALTVRGNARLRDVGLVWSRLARGVLPGGLQIARNPSLTQVDAAAGVREIRGDLLLANNTALAQIDGLGGLSSVHGGVVIEGNSAIPGLDGLMSLEAIGATAAGASLTLARNVALRHTGGLRALHGALRGAITVCGNARLSSLGGLRQVRAVGRDARGRSLLIRDNRALASIDGLGGLRGALPGSVGVEHNPMLASLAGLDGITSIGPSTASRGLGLVIANNGALRHVGLGALARVLGAVGIRGNMQLRNLLSLERGLVAVCGDVSIRDVTCVAPAEADRWQKALDSRACAARAGGAGTHSGAGSNSRELSPVRHRLDVETTASGPATCQGAKWRECRHLTCRIDAQGKLRTRHDHRAEPAAASAKQHHCGWNADESRCTCLCTLGADADADVDAADAGAAGHRQ
eukprot:g2546.t1